MTKHLRVTMPDGSKWDVPIGIIARSYVGHYGEADATLDEMIDRYNEELVDWAENNMGWSDVAGEARQVGAAETVDYQDGWMNGDKEIVENVS